MGKDEVLEHAEKKLKELTYSDKLKELEAATYIIELDHGSGNESERVLYVPWKLVEELLPVGKAQRKIVRTLGVLSESLNAGWLFDPWLCPQGRPIIPEELAPFYWVLVKGSPDEIAKLNPFVEFEAEEEDEEAPGREPVGYATIFLEHTDTPPEIPDGYAILHEKHIFAKGTVYTKTSKDEPTTV